MDAASVTEFVKAHPVLFAVTSGLDKKPQGHTAQLCYEEDGAMYFAAAKCDMYYGELSQNPSAILCAYDPARNIALTLRGTAVFTEDADIIARCFDECESLRARWGDQREMVIAYFFKDVTAEFTAPGTDQRTVIELGTPANALVGITIAKDTELRDRLSRIMQRREAAVDAPAGEREQFLQKLYDGALLYFAETAKGVWPRLDIGPIERSAIFDTYDERKRFTGLARQLIGNARIDKPEDLTYWINADTLSALAEAQQQSGGK